jgi:hypothetical protein
MALCGILRGHEYAVETSFLVPFLHVRPPSAAEGFQTFPRSPILHPLSYIRYDILCAYASPSAPAFASLAPLALSMTPYPFACYHTIRSLLRRGQSPEKPKTHYSFHPIPCSFAASLSTSSTLYLPSPPRRVDSLQTKPQSQALSSSSSALGLCPLQTRSTSHHTTRGKHAS